MLITNGARKLELCLSASICSFHFLYRKSEVSETLVGGKTQEKSYLISVFQQSYCYSPKPDQTHTGPNPHIGIYCTVDYKPYSRGLSNNMMMLFYGFHSYYKHRVNMASSFMEVHWRGGCVN